MITDVRAYPPKGDAFIEVKVDNGPWIPFDTYLEEKINFIISERLKELK